MQNFITSLNTNLQRLDNFSDIIFLCVGTDKIAGDAFGPIVGQKLKKIKNINVIGDLDNCIIYQNIEKVEKEIYKNYERPYIVCIDAALSKTIKKGQIVIEKNSLRIGNILGKKEKQIGNLSIKGVVAEKKENYKENFIELAKTPITLINSMAHEVVNGIKNVYLLQNWEKFN